MLRFVLLRWYDHDTRSRDPLDSTAIYPITQSLTKHHETGKIENPIKIIPLPCALVRLRSKKTIVISSRRITFLDCASLGEDSHDAPPYTKMGEALFGISSLGHGCWSTRTKPWSTHTLLPFLPLALIPTYGDQAKQMDTPTNISQYKH